MLNKMKIKNFKAFVDTEEIFLKPITLFCGTNSSGKSTLLHSLLLWKQTLESRNFEQTLLLNGRMLHLGTFSNIIHNHNTEKPITFEFSFKLNRKSFYGAQQTRFPYPWEILVRDLIPNIENSLIKDLIYSFDYKVELSTTAPTEPNVFSKAVIPRTIMLNVLAETQKQEYYKGIRIEIAYNSESNDYSVVWENFSPQILPKKTKPSGKGKFKHLKFINLIPINIIPYEEKSSIHSEVSFVFYRFKEILGFLFGSFTYLGPLREEPARRYIYEDEIVEIGIKGENSAYILMSEKHKVINNHFFYDPTTDSFITKKQISLFDSMNYWFSLMGIHSFEASSESEIIRLTLLSEEKSKTRVNIADVGFGVSQVLPIIIEGLRMNPGQTLILEQPEIHLHPKLQMQLADFIVSLALSKKNIVLETHSDHIVNRLVRRIAEDESGDLSELIGIHFVYKDKSNSRIEEIRISHESGIMNWPKEFFDQAALEQQKTMLALIKKRKGLNQ